MLLCVRQCHNNGSGYSSRDLTFSFNFTWYSCWVIVMVLNIGFVRFTFDSVEVILVVLNGEVFLLGDPSGPQWCVFCWVILVVLNGFISIPLN